MIGRGFGRYLALITAITFLLVLGVVPASADTLTSNLDLGDSAISFSPQPYGQLVVTLNNSITATIKFTANESPSNAYLFGSTGSVAVNVNASSWALGSIIGSSLNSSFNSPTYSNGGAGNEDGFGSFNQNINSTDGFTSSSNSIAFTLTNTGGTWASAANVLAFNGGGFDAAAHVFICNQPVAGCLAGSGAVASGFAAEDANGISTSPEPNAVVLLGSVLIGIAAIIRRKMLTPV